MIRRSCLVASVLALGLVGLTGAGLSGIEAADTIVNIQIAPQTFQLGFNQGGLITVHTDIPLRQVVRSSVQLDGLSAVYTKADSTGNLVAKFREQAVKALVSPPRATLTLTGTTVSGNDFAGDDTVRVTDWQG